MNKKLLLVAAILGLALCTEYTACDASSLGTSESAVNGICYKCHRTCATCSGPDADECLTCTIDAVTVSSNTCACAGDLTFDKTANDTAALADSDCSGVTATATTDCAIDGWYYPGSGTTCSECDRDTYKCITDGDTTADGNAGNCWNLALAPNNNDCVYAAANSWLHGYTANNLASTDTVVGYYYDSSASHEFVACAFGCATCSAKGGCDTCPTNYGLNAAGTLCVTCETDEYIKTADGKCTACPTNCKTCAEDASITDAGKCSECDDNFTLNSTDNTCTATTTTPTDAELTAAAVATNIAAAEGCNALMKGCTACDADDEWVCTACNATYFYELETTTKKCWCVTQHGYSQENGDCASRCTAACTTTGEYCVKKTGETTATC